MAAVRPNKSQFLLLCRAPHNRKNRIFIGHPDAGWRSAVIYSIIASCRRHGIDPWDYLKEALEGLAAATNKTVGSFTPAAWTARRRNQSDKDLAA